MGWRQFRGRAALALAAILMVPVLYGLARDEKPVRLAGEGGYPPFSEIGADGSLHGLDIDIGDAVCAAANLRCVWVRVEWERMIPALLSHKVDVIVASMTITDQRRERVDFTKRYYSAPLALVASRDSALLPTSMALRGRKIGVERGTVADDFATRFWSRHGVEIVRYGLQDEVELDLMSGRLDALLTDYWQAVGSFLARSESRNFAIAGGKIFGNTPEERGVIGEGIGMAVRKQDRALRELLNLGIATIRADGTYDRIVGRYFSEDIFGE
jgi:histidine transport system substrate-binding protein